MGNIINIDNQIYISDNYGLFLYHRYIMNKYKELYKKLQINYKLYNGEIFLYQDKYDGSFDIKKFIDTYAIVNRNGKRYLSYTHFTTMFKRILIFRDTNEGSLFWSTYAEEIKSFFLKKLDRRIACISII